MDAPGIRILLCPDGLRRGSRLRRGVPRHGRLPGSDPLDTPEGRCPSPDWIQIEDTGGTRIILAAVPAARPLRHDR
jgi:hypothetical protein